MNGQFWGGGRLIFSSNTRGGGVMIPLLHSPQLLNYQKSYVPIVCFIKFCRNVYIQPDLPAEIYADFMQTR